MLEVIIYQNPEIFFVFKFMQVHNSGFQMQYMSFFTSSHQLYSQIPGKYDPFVDQSANLWRRRTTLGSRMLSSEHFWLLAVAFGFR